MENVEMVYSAVLQVNYDLPLDAASGLFGYFSPYLISQNFNPGRTGKQLVEMNVYGFGKRWESTQGINHIEKKGLSRPNAHEIVTLGYHNDAKLDKVLNDYLGIVGLCEPWRGPDGNPVVPYLWVFHGTRRVNLIHFEGLWSSGDLVLGVLRK